VISGRGVRGGVRFRSTLARTARFARSAQDLETLRLVTGPQGRQVAGKEGCGQSIRRHGRGIAET